MILSHLVWARVVSTQKPLPCRPYIDYNAILCDGPFFVEGDDSETRTAKFLTCLQKRADLSTIRSRIVYGVANLYELIWLIIS